MWPLRRPSTVEPEAFHAEVIEQQGCGRHHNCAAKLHSKRESSYRYSCLERKADPRPWRGQDICDRVNSCKQNGSVQSADTSSASWLTARAEYRNYGGKHFFVKKNCFALVLSSTWSGSGLFITARRSLGGIPGICGLAGDTSRGLRMGLSRGDGRL